MAHPLYSHEKTKKLASRKKRPCNLCGKIEILVDSHIIPECFFRQIYPNSEGCIVSLGEHPKRSPKGIYDQIVCERCEQKFSPWDDYGCEFFAKILVAPPKMTVNHKGEKFFIYEDIKYKELKLFLMSILWRAGVCNQTFFDQVSIGPFKDQLAEKILISDPGGEKDYSVIITKFCISDNKTLHYPYKFKYGSEGVNGYKFYLFNSGIFIKVDSRPLRSRTHTPPDERLILSPGKRLIVFEDNPPKIIMRINKAG